MKKYKISQGQIEHIKNQLYHLTADSAGYTSRIVPPIQKIREILLDIETQTNKKKIPKEHDSHNFSVRCGRCKLTHFYHIKTKKGYCPYCGILTVYITSNGINIGAKSLEK